MWSLSEVFAAQENHGLRGAGLGIHERLRRSIEAIQSPERFQEVAPRLLARAQRFRQRTVRICRSFRTAPGRERLRLGVYARIPSAVNRLASIYRRTLAKRARIVAVVGSFGKTTTTRAVMAALGLEDSRHAGWNSKTALAGALLRIGPRAQHAVIEVGIDGKGQMESYARLLRPDIAVVTCIGSEHLTSFGTLKATRAEKAKMVSAIPSSGLVVLNGDDENVLWMKDLAGGRVITYGFREFNQVRATDVVEDELSGVRFRLHVDGHVHDVRSQLIGRHMIYPLLAAVAVAHAEGCNLKQAIAAFEGLGPTPGRLQPIQLAGGAWILLDAFKGTLETIEAALDTLAKLPAKRKIVVLGQVEQPPGSQGPIYRALGKRLAGICDHVVFVGGKNIFKTLRSGVASEGLHRDTLTRTRTDVRVILQALDEIDLHLGDLVLIKGRSNQHLERVALLLSGLEVTCSASSCPRRHDCISCLLLQHTM